MKILSIVGARPQFIKAAPVSRALRAKGINESLVHTGQHYDDNLSDLFFREMNIPKPDYNLEVGSGPQGRQTGQMLILLEQVIEKEKPGWVIVYGDTNSTLAGALAAVKLSVRLAHVEAGLRSYNRCMPEEHNRVLTDHCSDMLFCPTETAVRNLSKEGIFSKVMMVGDTMVDSIRIFSKKAKERSKILINLGITAKSYLLATVHRAENTSSTNKMNNIIEGLIAIDEPIIFPVHPRTRKAIEEMGLMPKLLDCNKIKMIEPIGYLDMLVLEENAKMILTDSGGIQKEAYIYGVPCVTLRDETEWVETVESGWNKIAGTNRNTITHAVCSPWKLPLDKTELFGDGHAAEKIAQTFYA